MAKGWHNESRRHSLASKGISLAIPAFGRKRSVPAFPKVMNRDQMEEWIWDVGLFDTWGELDINVVEEISGASDRWVLMGWSLDKWDIVTDPRGRGKRASDPGLPVIILDLGDGEYEVLDGVHRMGEAKYRGQKKILAYVGKPWGDN